MTAANYRNLVRELNKKLYDGIEESNLENSSVYQSRITNIYRIKLEANAKFGPIFNI